MMGPTSTPPSDEIPELREFTICTPKWDYYCREVSSSGKETGVRQQTGIKAERLASKRC
jgi:hypothetical protein